MTPTERFDNLLAKVLDAKLSRAKVLPFPLLTTTAGSAEGGLSPRTSRLTLKPRPPVVISFSAYHRLRLLNIWDEEWCKIVAKATAKKETGK